MEFKTLDHTADIGVEVRADSLAELFEGAATAMFSQVVDLSGVSPSRKREVTLQAGDLEELMFMWLNELLCILETDWMLFSRFEVRSIDGNRLEATVAGEELDPARHAIQREIKAATYHEMFVGRDGGGWVTRVIFDV